MIAATANLAWLASQAGARRRFRRQLASPAETQAGVLHGLLRRNAASDFGRQHGFADIRTPAEFARRVPLATADDLAPWIVRIKRGEPSVLTTDPVTHLIPTSGSSAARKLIPFTAQLQREFNAAIGPWIADLYAIHPRALFGPAYWSISPVLQPGPPEESAVPVGFEDDANYLGGVRRRIVAAAMAVPAALREVTDMESFFLLTLVCLLRRRDLRLISVWHPSFLLLLIEALPRHWPAILATIRTGRPPAGLPLSPGLPSAVGLKPDPVRADELARLGPARFGEFWPRLAVISCWTDAHAALAAAEIAIRFPATHLQPKGLLATEAVVTLPFGGAHPIAVGSHYFEFIDDAGAIHPVEALQRDQIYEVVVTTGGGLWRYKLGDRVQVDGFAAQTPSLRFVGRAGEVSDLFGEKLSGSFVTGVIQRLGGSHQPHFAMLAPAQDPSSGSYTLFWEGTAPPTADALDGLLAENPQYAWCRQLGQLHRPRIFIVTADATATYVRRTANAGQRLGDIKPPALSNTRGWGDCFTGHYAD